MTLIRPPVMPMATNMSHVVQLVLPLTQFVATLPRPLSWSDFVNLLPLKRLGKHERWAVGQRLCTEVLGVGRARYGAQLLDDLGQQLTQEFGRGFESRNLRRMMKFVECFTVKYP